MRDGVLGMFVICFSHHSSIDKTPGLVASDRRSPSLAMALFATLKSASILRMYDMKETCEALAMFAGLRANG